MRKLSKMHPQITVKVIQIKLYNVNKNYSVALLIRNSDELIKIKD